MQKKNVTLLLGIFLSFVFMFSLISAAQETTFYSFPQGIDIVEQQIPSIKANTNYEYHFHLLNSSNGYWLDNTSIECYLFIADSEGDVIFSEMATYFNIYWEVLVTAEKISEVGYYPYGLICYDGGIGGSLSGTFLVTKTGKLFEQSEATGYLLIILVLIVFLLLAGYGAIKIPYKNHRNEGDEIIGINDLKYLKIFFIAISYGILTWIANLMIVISNNYIDLGVAMGFFQGLFKFMIGAAMPLLWLTVIFVGIQVVRDWYTSKEIRRFFG
jgi:hypothetical protein